jgi:hypothetical protein
MGEGEVVPALGKIATVLSRGFRGSMREFILEISPCVTVAHFASLRIRQLAGEFVRRKFVKPSGQSELRCNSGPGEFLAQTYHDY